MGCIRFFRRVVVRWISCPRVRERERDARSRSGGTERQGESSKEDIHSGEDKDTVDEVVMLISKKGKRNKKGKRRRKKERKGLAYTTNCKFTRDHVDAVMPPWEGSAS